MPSHCRNSAVGITTRRPMRRWGNWSRAIASRSVRSDGIPGSAATSGTVSNGTSTGSGRLGMTEASQTPGAGVADVLEFNQWVTRSRWELTARCPDCGASRWDRCRTRETGRWRRVMPHSHKARTRGREEALARELAEETTTVQEWAVVCPDGWVHPELGRPLLSSSSIWRCQYYRRVGDCPPGKHRVAVREVVRGPWREPSVDESDHLSSTDDDE